MSKFLFGFAVMMIASTPAFAVQTYALKCRSGDQSGVNVNSKGEISFGFQKASMAAGANEQNLRNNQYAFVDRALGANEPNRVVATVGPNFVVGFFMPNALSSSKGYAYAVIQGYVYDYTTKDTILTIYVYNDGSVLRAPNP